MSIQLTCKYCDHKWDISKYSMVQNHKCPKCGDTNVTAKDTDDDKIDSYKGCPPFPIKKTDDWGMY